MASILIQCDKCKHEGPNEHFDYSYKFDGSDYCKVCATEYHIAELVEQRNGHYRKKAEIEALINQDNLSINKLEKELVLAKKELGKE